MSNYTTITSDKSKRKALMLCLLGILGIGGIHYFYVGRYGMGLLYFLTCGMFFLGTIADLIKIASGGFKDNAGAPLREN